MIITTSRKPSQRTRSFARDLERVLNIPYVQRGKLSLKELFEIDNNILLIGEFRGNPGSLVFYNLEKDKKLSSFITVKLQREICGGKVENNNGIKIKINYNNEYLHLYEEFFFNHFNINNESNFTLSVEKDSKYLFAIQFYKNRVKIGPLIRVKSVKLFDSVWD
ncbi:ribosomal biogenesis protein [Methanocaldococcus indicus]|uniref:ribosomal biogenesis protein n=1 Tax=Methanocaldococcus indicus TaxID=213231 RepID=UPI003C6D00B9